MLEAFKLGGWGMFPTLICGLLTVAISVRYAVKPEKRLVPLLVTTNLMTVIAGMLGFVTGVITTAMYVGGIAKVDVPQIATIGVGESLHNIALALVLMMLAAIASTVGAFRISRAETA